MGSGGEQKVFVKFRIFNKELVNTFNNEKLNFQLADYGINYS